MVEVVRGALRRLVEPQESTLLVNPEDVETVRDAVEEIAAEHGAPLTVRAERRVPRGGCVLRTQAGEIDARIASQLERARGDRRRGAGRVSEPLRARAAAALRRADLQERRGRVRDVIGLVVEATGLDAEVGEVCLVETGRDREPVPAEVVGFRGVRHAADAARRDARDRPRQAGLGDRRAASGCRSARRCSAASSTASAGPSTATELGLTARRPRDLAIRRRRSGRPRIERRLRARRARARRLRPLRPSASGSASSPAPASASPRCWG